MKENPIVRSISAILRAVALGLFGLFLVLSVPRALTRSAWRFSLAASTVGEDPAAARRRLMGEPWVEAIERIRQAVPRDGEYLLVSGGEWALGCPYWVRFDLAPRRALYVGQANQLTDVAKLRSDLEPTPLWVVVAFQDRQPPLLLDRETFLAGLERMHGGS
jgi:hypothetical protein